ncbi:MAG: ribosome-associated translation inhibitor RaiA [Patescibacteria group bacterium]|jgi:ribosomal subunit interface protein
MNLQISGKNLELTAALREYIEKKMASLSKYNEHIMDGKVTLEPAREGHAEAFRVTARLHLQHDDVFTEETRVNAYEAIDVVHNELERQLHDVKSKYEALQRKAGVTKRNLKSI